MFKKIILSTAALACAAFISTAQAQEAASLDELLRIVQQGRAAEQKEAREREQEFLRDKNNQQSMLQKARNDLAAEERTSEQLEKQYADNELEIGRKLEQYQERLGELNELFGVLQQVAGDTRSQIISSPVSLQVPGDRAGELKALIDKTATGTRLPKIAEVRGLYSALLQEMVEGGKVARFTAPVTQRGEATEQEVVRVGMFQLVSDGKFLEYDVPAGETKGQLLVLPSQPAGHFLSTAGELQQAQSGLVDFAIDPLRGQLLKLQGQNPTLGERVAQGGVVGYITLSLGAIAVLVTIVKLVYLMAVGSKMRSQIKDGTPRTDNPLGRVLQVYHDNRSVDVETLELKMDEAILKETPGLDRGNTFVKIVSVVAPLLGLFGTVTGMIQTFQAITLFGTGDPKVMAGGISQALVTTVLGLVVAIPTVLLHSFLASRTKSLIHVLEEQAAGIIAVHAEKEGGARA